MTARRRGPLHGIRVLEVGGMGPGPFAGMLLSDMGADVVRIERPAGVGAFPRAETRDNLNRGKRSVVLDLKKGPGVAAALAMAERADVVVEGHRPGVMERLGMGPQDCFARNRALVYGRMTGWGQTGPLSRRAGHDVNYIALTGALGAIGPYAGPPSIPLNLVGDLGGGGMYLVSGILAALFEARQTGEGQVVDAAIVDGTLHLLSAVHGLMNEGLWEDQREANVLDGAAPYYGVYKTADGRYMSVGAIEPKFYAQLMDGLGVDVELSKQNDRETWSETKEAIAASFAARTQQDWIDTFGGTDACVAPVMSLAEAQHHPHIAHRRSLATTDGLLQAAPAPRFSNYPSATLPDGPPMRGQHTNEALREWGVDPEPLFAPGSDLTRAIHEKDV